MMMRNGIFRPPNYGYLSVICLVGLSGYWIGKCADRDLTTSFPSRHLEASATDTIVGGDFDDSEELYDEKAEQFLNVTVVVVIVLLLLFLTILFEHGKEHLEEICQQDGQHMTSILEKLFGEMTVLGFLSIVTFIITQTGTFRAISQSLYGDQEELLEIFELVHFTIFFVMVFFVIQVFVLVKGAIQTEHTWVHMDRAVREQKLRAEEHCEDISDARQEPTRGADSPEQALFEALRDEFILERHVQPPFDPAPASHQVADDFPFGRYLSVCLGNLLTHAVEVNSATWMFFAVATAVYYLVCLSVEEDVKILTWIWVGVSWAVFLFNIIFERHLISVRNTFVATPTTSGDSETTQLLNQGARLPLWCQVDLDAYLRSRSWITRCVVGGTPNRQQALFWMDAKGPKFYLIILQINLVFTGLYTAIQLLEFLPVMYNDVPLYEFFLYLVFATLPVLGIMLNKQRLVATLSQVCCMGVYRRPQVVSTVLREKKTVHVVRAFIILYKLRQMAERSEHSNDRYLHHSRSRTFGHLETEEISAAFDAFDHTGDGVVTYGELKLLLTKLGAPMDDESIQKVIKILDVNNDGSISKAEFLQWYAEQEGQGDEISERERAEFLFEMFDENGTGSVTIGEFKRKLDALHAGLTVDDVGAIVNELDHDDTGCVGPEEFEYLIRKYYPRELRSE